MKQRSHLILTLIFICTTVLALVIENAASVEAKGLADMAFHSPIHREKAQKKEGDDDNGPPPPSTKGEFEPGQGSEEKPIKDPETPAFSVIFPRGSVSDPIKVRFFSSGLPQDVPALSDPLPVPNSLVPTSMNSPYFFFAAWKRVGAGGAVHQFTQPIVISVPYQDSDLLSAQEVKTRLWMYNPATRSWVKLGGEVDIFNNIVTGLLLSTTPLEENGNTLFTIAIDNMPELKQVVDSFGNTTLSIPGRDDFRFQVPPGAVEVGTHFEVTQIGYSPDSHLLTPPVEIAAYYINHQPGNYLDDRQIIELAKPIRIEFDITGTREETDFTLVTLQNGEWVDVASLGYPVIIEGGKVIVEVDKLGAFGLAAK